MVRPWVLYGAAMKGSIRHRGGDSWQLRVYLGVDAVTSRQRWATTTVHGTKRYATCRLAEFVEEAGRARIRAGTVADLLTRWMEVSTPRWSPSTLRQNRSVVVHHLIPLLGHLRVDDVFTTDIDDLYRHLLVRGGADATPLTAGTVARISWCAASCLHAGGCGGNGCGSTRSPPRHRLVLSRARSHHRRHSRLRHCSPRSNRRIQRFMCISGWLLRPAPAGVSCSVCDGLRSISSTAQSAFTEPGSRAPMDQCCVRRRLTVRIGWRSIPRRPPF